jgi:protoporphyrinogen oxidase
VAPEELDAALGAARVQKGSPWALLRAATGRGRSSGRSFFYPERGAGDLADGLAARIRAAGGEIRCAAPAEGLLIEGGRVVGVRCGGRELPAASVIATLPLPLLCSWAGVGEVAAPLSYRALVLLYLVLGVERGSPHDVHYFSDEAIPANRLFEMKGFSGGAGPKDRTVIGFDIPCSVDDALWRADAPALIERIRPALHKVGMGDAKILGHDLRRVPTAYPIYRRGFDGHRTAALDALARVEGLYPTGRHALFVHDNVHHACAAGLAAGAAAAAGAGSAAWRREQARFLHAQIED